MPFVPSDLAEVAARPMLNEEAMAAVLALAGSRQDQPHGAGG
ncbi:hypothetical protein TA3x_001232 [Tundrisphaera sp. TA3]